MTDDPSVSIRRLTEQRVIEVQMGLLRGSRNRIYVDVCVECGAVVFDLIRHDTWHNRQREEAGDG